MELPLENIQKENFARYILYSRWIRSDSTIRADAFIPYPYPDLSVTRHQGLSESEIWQAGTSVAVKRKLTLYGRADIKGFTFVKHSLSVKSEPIPDNPNHVNITGWPAEKPLQKIIALQIAAESSFCKYSQ